MIHLLVYYETVPVGRIEAGSDGPSFVYEPRWLSTKGAFPLSITMPLSPHPVSPAVFQPWAANLLPEGQQLKAIGRTLGSATEDVIAILEQIGRDTAGALSIGQPGTTSPTNWKPVERESDLERILEELPSKPFLVGDDGVSMSLAGVQSKIGVAVDSQGRICIPLDGSPSTHILKPDADNLYGSVHNEALCLVLARRCGLTAPDVSTGTAGKRQYLLVTRYDRLEQKGRWRRLHQEDFCQALGKPPAAKYESNQTGIKGPTLVDMFALTRNAMAARDLLRLLDHVLFNILVCNTDAHAKNYSLMITGRGCSVAPIYDVMCAAAWDNITKNLAQKVAGKNRGEHLKRRHWSTMATECGFNATRLIARINELATTILAQLPAAVEEIEAMPAGTHVMLPHFTKAIADRAHAVMAGLREELSETAAEPAATAVKTKAKRPKVEKAENAKTAKKAAARRTKPPTDR